MRCTKCGAELAPEDKFCGECGAPRPRLPAHFEAAEREFAALKARYEAGELSEAEYDAELEKLVIQDEAGAEWILGAGTGQGYRYDGQPWGRADPPLSGARMTGPQSTPAPCPAPPAA
nr:zinc-ribbon domain-containing protein [Anaerolineales bacterium]